MNRLSIIMYHYVRDLHRSRYPGIKGLDFHLFKEQISFFINNYSIIRMEELIAAVRGQKKLPENALLLTFDDGYIDNYSFVFPVLDEYHIQGSFFVPGKVLEEHKLLEVNKIHYLLAAACIEDLFSDLLERMNYYRGSKWNYPSNEDLFAEYAIQNRFDSKEIIFFKRILQTVLPEDLRTIICDELYRKYIGVPEETLASELYLNHDQIKLMKRCGMFFGVHGYEHNWLNRLGKSELMKDIDKGISCMSDVIDTKEWVMNYPYGSYNDDVVKYISKKGCVLGLSTDLGIADPDKDNRYTLPRLDTNDFPPRSSHYKSFSSKA